MQTYDDWFYGQFPGGRAGVEWNATGVDLVSTSAEGADEQRAKVLQYFFSKMEIDWIGEGSVAKLIEHGFFSAVGIINNPEVLEEVIGENGRKAGIMMKKILESTTPQRLFAALGLFGRGLGERKLKVVFDKYTVEEVLSGRVSVEEYCELQGYDVKSAELLHCNASSANTIYQRIKSKVKFVQPKAVVLGKGALINEVIIATGVRLSPEMIAKVQSMGGEVVENFSKAITILVCKDIHSTSGKTQKARDLGIKIISLAELTAMV